MEPSGETLSTIKSCSSRFIPCALIFIKEPTTIISLSYEVTKAQKHSLKSGINWCRTSSNLLPGKKKKKGVRACLVHVFKN